MSNLMLSPIAHRWVVRVFTILGAAVFLLVFAVAVALLLNVTTPYQPFAVRGVHVTTAIDPVCPGDEVRVQIDRKFTESFKRLDLQETWVSMPDGRPVKSADGTLPAKAVQKTRGFALVDSPLLKQAPEQPGTYRVQVVARPTGTRFFGLQATGKATYHSGNTITVTNCTDSKGVTR